MADTNTLPDFIPLDQVVDDIGVYPKSALPDFIPFDQVIDDVTPSIWEHPIDALTSKDWWFTRPSGQRVDTKTAIAGAPLAALDALTLGAGDEVSAGGNAILDAIVGGPGYDARLAEARAIQDNTPTATKVATGIGYGLKLPIGSVETVKDAAKVGAALGGASGFLSGEGTEDRLKGAIISAPIGGVVGGALTAAGNGLSSLASSFNEGGRRLELSAYGAGKRAINNAYKRMPDVLDDQGNQINPISQAIKAFREDGGDSNGMGGQALLDALNEQTAKYSDELGQKLAVAQTLQKDAIIPEFKITQKYINNLAGADKSKAEKMASDLIDDTLNATDGTILNLQTEKQRISNSIKDSAWGNDPTSSMEVNIRKRIRADLRNSIEENYSSLTGRPAKEVAELNAEIGKRESLSPIFQDLRTSDEARNPLMHGLRSAATTIGFGTPAIGLAASGAGGAIAGVPIALGAYATTPTGQRQLSDALRSSITQLPSKAINGAYPILTSSIGRALTSGNNVSQTQEILDQAQKGELNSYTNASNSEASTLSQTDRFGSYEADLQYPKKANQSKQQESQSRFYHYSNQENSLQGTPKVNDSEAKTVLSDAPTSLPSVKPTPEASPLKNDVKAFIKSQPKLVQAVIQTESSGNPNAKSPTGPQGLMQLTKYIRDKFGVEDGFDPHQNVKGGTEFLNYLLKTYGKYDDGKMIALAAYNQGESVINDAIRRVKDKGLTPTWSNVKAFLPKEGQKYPLLVAKNFQALSDVEEV